MFGRILNTGGSSLYCNGFQHSMGVFEEVYPLTGAYYFDVRFKKQFICTHKHGMSSFLIGIQNIYQNVSQNIYLINCVFLLLQGPQRTMPLKSSRQNESHGILFWAESHESRHSLGA